MHEKKKQLIVASDIYGKTKHLETLIKEISKQYDSVEIVEPYEIDDINFKDEAEAYTHFQETIGLKGYIERLHSRLQGQEHSEQTLLGFSVGASAIWAVSDKLQSYRNTKGICFYSSQVRDYLDITPKIKIDLYFSVSEPMYDVDEVITEMSEKPEVNCIKTLYQHGFMNKKSQNFSKSGYSEYLEIINRS